MTPRTQFLQSPCLSRPTWRRLADDFGLTIVVSALAAVLITLVNGKTYELYDQITPEDLREAARKYFVSNGRTIVTLTGPKAK